MLILLAPCEALGPSCTNSVLRCYRHRHHLITIIITGVAPKFSRFELGLNLIERSKFDHTLFLNLGQVKFENVH